MFGFLGAVRVDCGDVVLGFVAPGAVALGRVRTGASGEVAAGSAVAADSALRMGVRSSEAIGRAFGVPVGRTGVPESGDAGPAPPAKYELSAPIAVAISERRG